MNNTIYIDTAGTLTAHRPSELVVLCGRCADNLAGLVTTGQPSSEACDYCGGNEIVACPKCGASHHAPSSATLNCKGCR